MRLSRKLAALAAAAFVVFGGATTALAITNGVPDQNGHPYVGLMVAQDANGAPLWRCSGTLISSTVFLTAGHCTQADEGGDVARAQIWFDSGYPAPIALAPGYPAAGSNPCQGLTGYPCTGDVGGTPHTDPQRNVGNPITNHGIGGYSYRDVGVVVLDSPYPMSKYGELPAAGAVDTLKNKAPIDFVGYGVQTQANIPGSALPQPPPYYRWTGPRTRMFAPSQLVSGSFSWSAEYMRLALNPGGGSGGTCFGDSGGPDLVGGSDVVLAVNSYVTNVNCSGVGYSSRVDIPDVLEWVQGFMAT